MFVHLFVCLSYLCIAAPVGRPHTFVLSQTVSSGSGQRLWFHCLFGLLHRCLLCGTLSSGSECHMLCACRQAPHARFFHEPFHLVADTASSSSGRCFIWLQTPCHLVADTQSSALRCGSGHHILCGCRQAPHPISPTHRFLWYRTAHIASLSVWLIASLFFREPSHLVADTTSCCACRLVSLARPVHVHICICWSPVLGCF